jgi:starch synthase (maltosyl-transferring)
VVLNLDAENKQWGHINLKMHELGKDSNATFEVIDLLSGTKYEWGSNNFVELGAHKPPAHIMHVR